MSEALQKFNVKTVLDSRVYSEPKRTYLVQQGSQHAEYRTYPVSNIDVSQMTFTNINPTNSQVYVNRVVALTVMYEITFLGVGGGAGDKVLAGYGTHLAPRDMFVHRSLKTTNLTINGTDTSENTSRNMSAHTRVNFRKYRQMSSGSPTVTDESQSYDELVGAVRNPLSSMGNGSINDDVASRGNHWGWQVISDNGTTAVVQLTGTENLLLSPFDSYEEQSPGFIGIETMQLNFNFEADLGKALLSIANSSAGPVSINSVSVVPKLANIKFTYYTPPLNYYIPPINSYEFNKIQLYPKQSQAGLLAPGITRTDPGDAIYLASIPKKIIVIVKQTETFTTFHSTDTFARINSVNIKLGNDSGILASATSYDLWKMSKDNLVDMEYSQWYGRDPATNALLPAGARCSMVGSVFAFNPAIDLGLVNLEASGTTGKILFQIDTTYTNLHPSESQNFTVNIYTVESGVLTIGPNSAQYQTSVVSPLDLFHSSTPDMLSNDSSLKGRGGFAFGPVLSFLKSAVPFLIENVPKVIPHIQNAYQYASRVQSQKGNLLDRILNKDNLSLIGLGGCGTCGMGGCEHYNDHCPMCRQAMASGLLGDGDGYGDGLVGGAARYKPYCRRGRGGEMISREDLARLL
jgi:hypothetical protein